MSPSASCVICRFSESHLHLRWVAKSDTELTVHWLWQVISIPFFKWEALTTPQARSQYLCGLLPLSSQEAQDARPATTMPAVPSLQGFGNYLGST